MKYFTLLIVQIFSIAAIADDSRIISSDPGSYNVSTGILQPVEVIHISTEEIDKFDLAKKCVANLDIENPPENMFPPNEEEMIERKYFTGRCKLPNELRGWRLLLTPKKSYELIPKFVQVDVIYTNSVLSREIIVSTVSQVSGHPDEGGVVIKPKIGYKAKNLEFKQVLLNEKYAEGSLIIDDSDGRRINAKTMSWIDENGEKYFLKEFFSGRNDTYAFNSSAIYKIKGEVSNLLLTSFHDYSGSQGSCISNYQLFALGKKVEKVGEYNYGCIGHH